MFKLLKKAAMVGLGLHSRVNEVVDEWVDRGEKNQSKEAKKVKNFLSRVEKDGEALDQKLSEVCSKVLSVANLATREEVTRLAGRVDDLVQRFDRRKKGAS